MNYIKINYINYWNLKGIFISARPVCVSGTNLYNSSFKLLYLFRSYAMWFIKLCVKLISIYSPEQCAELINMPKIKPQLQNSKALLEFFPVIFCSQFPGHTLLSGWSLVRRASAGSSVRSRSPLCAPKAFAHRTGPSEGDSSTSPPITDRQLWPELLKPLTLSPDDSELSTVSQASRGSPQIRPIVFPLSYPNTLD